MPGVDMCCRVHSVHSLEFHAEPGGKSEGSDMRHHRTSCGSGKYNIIDCLIC